MSGRRDLPNFWSRSTSAKQLVNSAIFQDEQPAPRRIFVASFENDTSKPPMNLLLGWEYGRIWLRERDEFLKETSIKTKNKFIKPDFSWWIAKRTMVPDRRKLFKKRLDDQQSFGKASMVSTTPNGVGKQRPTQAPTAVAAAAVAAAVGKKKSSTKSKEKSKGKKSKKKTTAATKTQTENKKATTSSKARKTGGGNDGVNVVASSRRIC